MKYLFFYPNTAAAFELHSTMPDVKLSEVAEFTECRQLLLEGDPIAVESVRQTLDRLLHTN